MSTELDKIWEEFFKKKEPSPAPETKPPTPAEAPQPPAEAPAPSQLQPTPVSTTPAPAPPAVEEVEEEFDLTEDKSTGKLVVTIYGDKGVGKTTFALSFPGTMAVLSFDRKTTPVKHLMYGGDQRIRIYDAVRYEDESNPMVWLESCEKTYRYIGVLLDHIAKDPPDWIVIDGAEIFQQVTEMVMRYRNNLLPYQGIANMNLWKERRMYIRQVFNRCLSIAKKGVLVTTYTDKDKIVKDGELVVLKDIPRWIDALLYYTDVVIKLETDFDKTRGKKFYAIVESSKHPQFKTGIGVDVTNQGVKALGVEL